MSPASRLPGLRARIGAAVACLLLHNACFEVAGGSGDTGNPELELALEMPKASGKFSGTLRIFARDHDPMEDSLPLLTRDAGGKVTVRIPTETLAALLEKGGRAGPDDTLEFNCLLSDARFETFLGGFRFLRRDGKPVLERRMGTGIQIQDIRGRLRVMVPLDSAVTHLRGLAHGEGLEDEAEWVALPGTPYRANVREGEFHFDRIAPGRYAMQAVLPSGERFVSGRPFRTDSAALALPWTKEGLVYRATDSGLSIAWVDSTNPMVYDNDLFAGGVDDEYMWAKASAGASLKGIIATREMSFSSGPDTLPGGYSFTLQHGLDEARASVERARRSGMRNLPDPVAGAGVRLVKPASGRIRDTRAAASPGTDLILAAARNATPRKPLVLFVGGGQATTVANAYLLDPSITRRMVVIGTGLDGKTKDPWAAWIVAKRCKLLNFGESRLWWPQRPLASILPPDRFAGLPRNEVNHALDSLATLNWENSLRPVDPTRDGGFNDGAGLFLVFAPRSWQAVARLSALPGGSLEDAGPTGPFDLAHAIRCDFAAMTESFFSTLGNPRVFSGP